MIATSMACYSMQWKGCVLIVNPWLGIIQLTLLVWQTVYMFSNRYIYNLSNNLLLLDGIIFLAIVFTT